MDLVKELKLQNPYKSVCNWLCSLLHNLVFKCPKIQLRISTKINAHRTKRLTVTGKLWSQTDANPMQHDIWTWNGDCFLFSIYILYDSFLYAHFRPLYRRCLDLSTANSRTALCTWEVETEIRHE